MYARIDRDYLVAGLRELGGNMADWPTRVGTTFGTAESSGERVRFRLLDDDGEVYYGGESDDEALEAVYEFGLRDAGSVVLETKSGLSEWKAVIA